MTDYLNKKVYLKTKLLGCENIERRSTNMKTITDTLIVLPAKNVESHLKILLEDLYSYRESVIFVNDGSTDKTKEILDKSGFRYLDNYKNMGISYSLYNAALFAMKEGYSNILVMDADGQHQVKYINEFLEKIKQSDFVLGDRFSNPYEIPNQKKASNAIGSLAVLNVFKIKLNDISCGFKAFKINDATINCLKDSNDYEYVFNLLFMAIRNDYRLEIVNMDAIYYIEELLMTRRKEIYAFLNILLRYVNKDNSFTQTLLESYDNIVKQKDFHIIIGEIEFYGFYLSIYDSYIIQTDENKINQYFKS